MELIVQVCNVQGTGWRYVVAIAISVFVAVGLVGVGLNQSDARAVELYAKRPLTPEEKKFVAHATSTPNKDLHRAPKLTSEMGQHDMNSFYDDMSKKTEVKDQHIQAKIKTLHKKASTLSAMHDINHYFDSLSQQKKEETKKNLEKESGKGKQALEEVNSYFDELDQQEKAQNEKDILNLGTGASVAEVRCYIGGLCKKSSMKRTSCKLTCEQCPSAYFNPSPTRWAGRQKACGGPQGCARRPPPLCPR